ncbi:MAG: hypothetical protein QOI76_3422 [Frankiales bacterium]|jgi:hypothetical protein|nr:hypothetical protein [Frankiales bacterium]
MPRTCQTGKVPQPTDFDPVLSVIGALLVVGLLLLLARWAFSPAPRASGRRQVRDADPEDYGLLTPVATAPTREDAEMLREVLTSNGIRCTLAPAGGGRRRSMHVLVFLGDADRAKNVVGTR